MIISLSKTWSAEFLTSPLQRALLFCNLPFCSDASSVASGEAKGRGYSPHWPEEYAKHPVFGTFETDFCTKNENSPPPVVLAMIIDQGSDVISNKKLHGFQPG